MKLLVQTGWGYAPESCRMLTDKLSKHFNVVLRSFVEELNPRDLETEPYWLAGWSLGGIKAIESVASGIIRPRGLILISSTARFCAHEDYMAGVDRSALRSMIIGIKRSRIKTLEIFYRDAAAPVNLSADELHDRIQQADEFSDEQLRNGLQSLDQLDVRGILSAIEIPTLILHGGQDRIIPISAGEFLSRGIKSSQLVDQSSAGHEMLLTHGDWMVDQITEFIHRHEGDNR
ncbi:MAG TPA: alpha/beta fold hydrolase [Kiritimatiellia bacterium]|nr:alpha/beta fold hydrolase [Kiritimatiellia bacterium]